MSHIDDIADFLLEKEHRVLVVLYDTSPERLMMRLAERIAGISFDDASGVAGKLALANKYKDKINEKLEFSDGSSRYFLVPTHRIPNSIVKGNILSVLERGDVSEVLFDTECRRWLNMSKIELNGWYNFKSAIKTKYSLDFSHIEEYGSVNLVL